MESHSIADAHVSLEVRSWKGTSGPSMYMRRVMYLTNRGGSKAELASAHRPVKFRQVPALDENAFVYSGFKGGSTSVIETMNTAIIDVVLDLVVRNLTVTLMCYVLRLRFCLLDRC